MHKFILGSMTAISLMSCVNESNSGRSNPLLIPSSAPFQSVPFNKISTEDYEEAISEGIKLHNKEIDVITSSDDDPSFENTIAALDRSGVILNGAVQTLSNLEAALGDTVLMNIMTKVTPLLTEHSTNLLLNEKLFERIKAVYDKRDERTDLSPEAQRLISETYRSFAESGANLKGDAREEFRKLSSKLSDLNVRFSQNVTNDMANPNRRLWVKEEDTKGLPESIKKASREAAREALESDGKTDDPTLYLFSMFAPSYSPFMMYAENRDLREKLYKMYNSRNIGGEFDNTKILKDIANLRLQIAKLMGKKHFAEYHLQGTMAANTDNVMNLLQQLRNNYTEPMKKEIEEIQAFARKSEGDNFMLQPWDYSFWSDKLKNARYSFNDEDLKPYFELNNTIAGVLGLATKLYGYTFKENKDIPVYHPDVKAFEVFDKDGSVLGILYADFFYRAGKSPGAWMTEFRPETKDDKGNRTLPLISIVCNFSKPVGNEPVLLTPGEVETFLHEFGHALHGLSSQATFASLSGTNVYHDFVELFSQFNENYLTEKEFLDGFARHYKTGEKLPSELLGKFLRAQQYGAAYSCMRQLGFGYLDMAYHTIENPLEENVVVEEFEKNAQDPVRIFEAIDGCATSPSFGHIFSGGYAAGYYGYKWAEVLDADALMLVTEWKEFRLPSWAVIKKTMAQQIVLDGRNIYEKKEMEELGFTYHCIGK